jgi:murein L,D-transpeptidase YafK
MTNTVDKATKFLGVLLVIALVLLVISSCQRKSNAAVGYATKQIKKIGINTHKLIAGKDYDTIALTKPIDSVMVEKSKGLMYVYFKRKKIKTYICGVGSVQDGHKKEEGDNRTPEGLYALSSKTNVSSYYKNFHINYPNAKDIARAKKRGVKPGGEIKIHGYADSKGNETEMNTRFTYTWGCVSLTNTEMDELYKYLPVPSPIFIKP